MRTHVGNVRTQNEDAAWYDEARGIYAVADGMGGHRAGEVASSIAIDMIRQMVCSQNTAGITPLREAVHSAHEAILAHAREHHECDGMGTTLSALWRGGKFMYIAHVGDSRIYRLRGRQFEQITQDHSLVEELVTARMITREEARVHPRRNIITRALGTQGDNEPDMLAAQTQAGDIWLLCTDGLNTMVTDAQIAKTLRKYDLSTAADSLIHQALDADGKDNVTLIVYRDEGDGAWNRD